MTDTVALSFVVARPGFRLERRESHDRSIRYTSSPYPADQRHGNRHNGQR